MLYEPREIIDAPNAEAMAITYRFLLILRDLSLVRSHFELVSQTDFTREGRVVMSNYVILIEDRPS